MGMHLTVDQEDVGSTPIGRAKKTLAWTNGLSHLVFTQEIAGSNPVASPRISGWSKGMTRDSEFRNEGSIPSLESIKETRMDEQYFVCEACTFCFSCETKPNYCPGCAEEIVEIEEIGRSDNFEGIKEVIARKILH